MVSTQAILYGQRVKLTDKPRASKVKAKQHASAAQLPAKRTFVADGKVEHVLPGSNLEATVSHSRHIG